MTEKRFTVTQTTFGSGIYDYQAENELCESYDEDAYGEVCKKLNEFDKENKELKIKNGLLSDELEQAKAVIDKKWDEYLKKKELSE